ncbi:MAG: glycosyltransferase family 61 protein, partial [Pseudomonadota bacterium]
MAAKTAPSATRVLNLHVDEAQWSEIQNAECYSWTEQSSLVLPEDIVADLSAVYQHELRRCGVVHRHARWDYDIIELPIADVLTHSGQVIAPNGKSLTPISRNTARPALLRRGTMDGPVLSLLPPRLSRNYYHYLIEETVQIRSILKRLFEDHPRIIGLVRRNPPAYEAQFRAALRSEFPGLELCEVGTGKRLTCSPLIAYRLKRNGPFRSPPSRDNLAHVVSTYLDAYAQQVPKRGEYPLLVSRKDARIRKLINEDALFERLQPFGAKRITPGTLSHAEQVAAFSKASVVIGTHGAGLTNLIFTPPATPVIEISGANYSQGAYMWLCALTDRPHHRVITELEGSHQNISLDERHLSTIETLVDQ